MADITATLTDRIEASAVKRVAYSTEVVRTDGGSEHRNARWADPLAEWDITIPPCKRTSTDYLNAIGVFTAAQGSLLTFDFHDPVDCLDHEVRIKDDSVSITGVGNLVTVSMTLVEVRSDGNSP